MEKLERRIVAFIRCHKYPKYFKVRELLRYNDEGKLIPLFVATEIIGFYVLDGDKLKNVYISEEYRGQGYAKQVFSKFVGSGVTVATVSRKCPVRHMVELFGGIEVGTVMGKYSDLTLYAL